MGTLGEIGSVERGLTEASSNGFHPPLTETPAEKYLNFLYGINCRALAEDAINSSGYFSGNIKLPPFKHPPGRHEHKKILEDGQEIREKSPGLYLVETPIERHLVLVSWFPSDEDATGHHHIYGIREHYFSLGGDSRLRLNDRVIDLGQNKGRFITVEENTWHQFTTKMSPTSSGALTLLIMENAGLVSSEELHKLGHPDL